MGAKSPLRMVNQVHAELNADSSNPTTLIQLANALLPMGALPRMGHTSAQPSGCRGQGFPGGAGTPGSPPRPRDASRTPRSPRKDESGMHSSSPSRSRHRAAYLPRNPGSLALLRRRARAGGATSPCKRREGRNPPGKTPGDDSPALDHPGASLQKEHSPTGCSPKAKGPTPALGQRHGPRRDTVVPAEDRGTCQPPMDPLGQPRTNWRHWSFHMPALSALDPQGSNEYFRF